MDYVAFQKGEKRIRRLCQFFFISGLSVLSYFAPKLNSQSVNPCYINLFGPIDTFVVILFAEHHLLILWILVFIMHSRKWIPYWIFITNWPPFKFSLPNFTYWGSVHVKLCLKDTIDWHEYFPQKYIAEFLTPLS